MRVFVSSAFRDMFAEREQLIKRTFPQIQQLCEARGVTWGGVDLRWGIPAEQAAEGKVLPLCLEEIQRCRPFFIGLLGERYGPPANFSSELLARQPWLAACQECSLTELEILHGVLNEPAAAEYALFYFRDPAYLDRLPVDVDPADFRSTETGAARLRDLKKRIRKSGASVREPYLDAQQLGAWVEADLRALVDRLFPQDAHDDPVAAAHLQFAAQRRHHWVGREVELRRLDEMLASHPAALVTGPPGVGLSSFLVNWAAAWRQRHPTTLVLEHYVGAHPGATNLDGCCRQLCLGLAAARNLPPPTVAVERDWADLFVEQLALAGAECPVLLVIDHADGFKGRGESAGADWLPLELPPGIQLVASASEEAVLAIESRGWPLLRLAELGSSERGELARRYLAASGKELSAERVRQIATASATGKPFYLILLLEELRQYGEHVTLGDRLSELLAAPDISHLCREIFSRCERDYAGAVPDFTARALGLLAVARFGLSDTELCELLGGPQGLLPQRPWSELQLALKAVLVSRDGVVGFAQSEPARVAWQRYVCTAERQPALQRQLADFFLARPDTARAAMELPFHLRQLAAWDELAAWMSRPDAFRVAWQLAPAEVCATWEAIEEHLPQRAAEACAAFPADLRPAALNLLRQLGHWADALVLAREAAQLAQAEGDPARQLETLLTVGEIELAAGSPYAAEEVFVQAEERAAAAQQPRELLRALRGRAQALDGQKERVTALARPELNRRSQEIGDRALRIWEGTRDAELRSEALVLWLEDLVGRTGGLELAGYTGTRDHIKIVGSFLSALLEARRPSAPIPGIEEALTRFDQTLDGRLRRLETEAVARLRHTRHRALALRADLAIARAEGDRARILTALEALRQHAAARDDLDLLARVYADLATQHQGTEKLAWLERQADLLARSGRQAALVRNWQTQAELLLPDDARRAEALALLRRATRERRALPSRRERRKLLIFRFLADDRLRRPAGWLVGPVFGWFVWRFCLWTSTWFWRLPLFGFIAYLFAALFGLPVLLLLLQNLSEVWTALRRRWPHQRARPDGDREPSPTENPKPARVKPPRAPRRSSGRPAATQQKDDLQLPKVLTTPFVLWVRLGRGLVRSVRIGKRLGLNRLPARLAWFALAVPAGSALTLCYWRASGCSRLLLLPLGLAGQMLVLGAVLGLLSPAIGPWAVRRTGRFASSGGSRIGIAGLLALIRLKRRLFRHRRRRASAHRPSPQAPGLDERNGLGDDAAQRARALFSRGDSKGALKALDEWGTGLRASPHPEARSKLLSCLKAQISLLPAAGELSRVPSLARELETVARELDRTTDLRLALVLQAAALRDAGDLAGALAFYQQEEALCRELDDLDGLLSSISNQASIRKQLGDLAGALELYRRKEALCRELGDDKGLREARESQDA